MSKKTHKKRLRKNMPVAVVSKKTLNNQTTAKSIPETPSVTVKTHLSYPDLKEHYHYVKDDLKNIALIAIPLIVILLVAAIFVKI